MKRSKGPDEFWIKTSWRKTELKKMNGKLNHLTLILPQLKPYLTANFRWLAGWSKRVAIKALQDVLEQISFWRKTVTMLCPKQLSPETVEWNLVWVGDSSTEYGIGILIGKKWAQVQWLDGWNTPLDIPRHYISWVETVAV